jgi:hypothetical protein
MKKIVIACAAMGLLSIGLASAQDSTRVSPSTQPTQQAPSSVTQPDPSTIQQPNDQYIRQNYSNLKPADVPSSLRSTLKGTEYSGWEKGQLYRSNGNNGYMLRTGTGDQMQSFYFDKAGKRTQSPTPAASPMPEQRP